MRTAMRMVGERIAPATNLSPIFPSRNQAKAEFSAVVLPFPNGELSEIADCSKETVKCWKAGRAFPIGDRLMALAAPGGNPTIRRWVAAKLGFFDPAFLPPETMHVLMAAAYQVMHQPGPDGDAVRAELSGRHPRP